MEIDWVLVTVALVVGALVGLTGVGAGAIMTPVLVGFFGASLPVAIATDLIFATVTKLIGVPFHHLQGTINWSLAGRMWMGSIPGALIGVGIVLLAVSREQTGWLVWPLVTIIFFTALTLGYRAMTGRGLPGRGAAPTPRHPAWALVGGFGIGSLVSLTSVGAGALGMALLVRLAPKDVEPRELVGTDLVHAIPVALVGGVVYSFFGLVDLHLLANLLTGSAVGVIGGSLLSGAVPSPILFASLSATLLTAGYLLI